MKHIIQRHPLYLFILSLCLCFVITSLVPAGTQYTLLNDHSVTIHGTSNLHDWDETVSHVSGDALVNVNTDKSVNLHALNITMEVRSIKSEQGSVMNKNTYKALKADQNPSILFLLTSPVTSIPLSAAERIISVKGNLTIAGATRAVDMKGTIRMNDLSGFTFEGSQVIKMSDYGVEPPEALLGTLKTGNEIIIRLKTNFKVLPTK